MHEPIQKSNISVRCYDLCEEDLNASVESIERLIREEKVEACLVASMYGNPADLKQIEELCKKEKVLLIDDAAQSLGAELEGRKIGAFGDAGFFSLACGKPVAAHNGAYYWTRNPDYFPTMKKKHFLYHLVSYCDYYFNRKEYYRFGKMFSWLNLLHILLNKRISNYYDSYYSFEEPIIGGAIAGLIEGAYTFREMWQNVFREELADCNNFRVVKSIRGLPHVHKLVLIAKDRDTAERLISECRQEKMYCQKGYNLINGKGDFSMAKSLENRIIAFPIENSNKMRDLIEFLSLKGSFDKDE